ncbi:alpha/beta-hydrolase [Ascodesmis nigricans]|uniref:Alpha/beta-hydrolase n=1 Tax=Ascodesmis nigricans TaxID=341454 RepID=A0A4S2MP68_9PEZI|nr:alpha/beta-hydrolase [Ascodesmis nigricans]
MSIPARVSVDSTFSASTSHSHHKHGHHHHHKHSNFNTAMATLAIKTLLPAVPSMFYKSATHMLSLSPTAHYWDLKTTVILEVIRAFVRTPPPGEHTVERVQRTTLKPQKVDDETVKVDVEFGVGGEEEATGIEDAVVAIVREMQKEEVEVQRVGVKRLTGEWVGRREKKGDGSMELGSEERFKVIEKGAEDGRTVLYFHGGAFYLLDPHTHRGIASQIAATSNSKVFLVRYRLSPQTAFPGALIDALISYLALLYPPPGSLHAPIPASKIIFSGDSAGGNLSLSLLQLLYGLSRSPQPITFHNHTLTTIPLPAGIATLSAWTDVPRSFGVLGSRPQGSEDACLTTDYLPSPQATAATVFHPSPAWNADVRKTSNRTTFYCADHFCANPLVSPVLAEHWSAADGSKVPIYLAVGDECLRDANLWLSWRLGEMGVKHRLEWYEKMPHVFQMVLGHIPATKESLCAIGRFAREVTGGEKAEEGWWRREKIHPRTLERRGVGEKEVRQGLGIGEVRGMMVRAVVEYRKIAERAVRDGEGRSAKI